MKLDGATLHFKTDDGAFDESASGSFTRQTSGLEPAALTFDGQVPAPFAGSYDTSPLLAEHPQDIVELYTALELNFALPGAAAGELAFEKNEQERHDFEIASWTVPSSGGFGGADTSVAGGGAYGGGGGSPGGAGGASDAGSGGAVGGIGGG